MTYVGSKWGWIDSHKIPAGAIECCPLCMAYVQTGDAPTPDLRFMQLWHADHTANPGMYEAWAPVVPGGVPVAQSVPAEWVWESGRAAEGAGQ